MNRDWVLWHLREALEELQRTVQEIAASPEYDDPEFWPAMQHLYHHLNTAWNSRHASPDEVEPGSDEAFTRWSQMPSDLPMREL